jgi:GNAT superfamily N-acetyltransferase
LHAVLLFLQANRQFIGLIILSPCLIERPILNVQIRAATEADLPSILTLYLELQGGGPILSVEEAKTIFSKMKSYPDYKLYVAISDGSIIGTFALLIMDNLALMGAPSGILEDVVVQRDWQGKGVGKEMMQFSMDRCRERGCYNLSLSSRSSRENAHQFYEGIGFRRHGYSFAVDLKCLSGQVQSTAKAFYGWPFSFYLAPIPC